MHPPRAAARAGTRRPRGSRRGPPGAGRRWRRRAAVLAAAVASIGGIGAAEGPDPAGPETAQELPDPGAVFARAEAQLHPDRTFLRATLVADAARPRELRFEARYDRSRGRAFVHVLHADGDPGPRFLWLAPNLWWHDPDEEETARIRPDDYRAPWMESGFTVDDLLRTPRPADHYEHRFAGAVDAPEEAPSGRALVVESTPKAGRPALWGRITTWVDAAHGAPLRREYRDADGSLRRVMEFADFRDVQGRRFPHRWTVRHPDRPEHASRIEVETVRFDGVFDEATFTIRHLESGD